MKETQVLTNKEHSILNKEKMFFSLDQHYGIIIAFIDKQICLLIANVAKVSNVTHGLLFYFIWEIFIKS